jgi:hypothetical protein
MRNERVEQRRRGGAREKGICEKRRMERGYCSVDSHVPLSVRACVRACVCGNFVHCMLPHTSHVNPENTIFFPPPSSSITHPALCPSTFLTLMSRIPSRDTCSAWESGSHPNYTYILLISPSTNREGWGGGAGPGGGQRAERGRGEGGHRQRDRQREEGGGVRGEGREGGREGEEVE